MISTHPDPANLPKVDIAHDRFIWDDTWDQEGVVTITLGDALHRTPARAVVVPVALRGPDMTVANVGDPVRIGTVIDDDAPACPLLPPRLVFFTRGDPSDDHPLCGVTTDLCATIPVPPGMEPIIRRLFQDVRVRDGRILHVTEFDTDPKSAGREQDRVALLGFVLSDPDND